MEVVHHLGAEVRDPSPFPIMAEGRCDNHLCIRWRSSDRRTSITGSTTEEQYYFDGYIQFTSPI
jgi:hypothetical protein